MCNHDKTQSTPPDFFLLQTTPMLRFLPPYVKMWRKNCVHSVDRIFKFFWSSRGRGYFAMPAWTSKFLSGAKVSFSAWQLPVTGSCSLYILRECLFQFSRHLNWMECSRLRMSTTRQVLHLSTWWHCFQVFLTPVFHDSFTALCKNFCRLSFKLLWVWVSQNWALSASFVQLRFEDKNEFQTEGIYRDPCGPSPLICAWILKVSSRHALYLESNMFSGEPFLHFITLCLLAQL